MIYITLFVKLLLNESYLIFNLNWLRNEIFSFTFSVFFISCFFNTMDWWFLENQILCYFEDKMMNCFYPSLCKIISLHSINIFINFQRSGICSFLTLICPYKFSRVMMISFVFLNYSSKLPVPGLILFDIFRCFK